jgi:hypothetical protein
MSTTTHRELQPFRASENMRPIEAYPSLRSAAKLIGVSAATLSRRTDLERVRAGREQRIPATEVVRLAAFYRRRAPSRVAAQLVQHAVSVDPGLEGIIGAEVDAALEPVPIVQTGVSLDIQAFLQSARQLLPAALAEQVEASVRDERHGNSATGWSPAAE